MDEATGKFLGLLSLSAVVSRLVHLFGERCAGLAHLSSHEFSQKDSADIAYQFQNLDIAPDLVSKVAPLKPGINIQEAIDFFVGPGNDSSQVRLPIVDEQGAICNLVSPTMILKFLSEHMEELPEKLVNRRISSIPGVISPSVKTCRSTDRTIDALAQMVMLQFSALGIEDVDSPHRHIVSIVTMKVKCVLLLICLVLIFCCCSQDAGHAMSDFGRLLMPVEAFVNEIRNEDLVDRAPTMNVPVDATVGITVKKFLAVQRHRMFVRQNQELVGIITVSDVLKAFSSTE